MESFGFRQVPVEQRRSTLRVASRVRPELDVEEPSGLAFVASLPDGRSALVLDAFGLAAICEVASGRVLAGGVLDRPETVAGDAAALCPGGRRVVFASASEFGVWDVSTPGAATRVFARAGAGVKGIAVHPDGTRAALLDGNGDLEAWDLEAGRRLWTAAVEPREGFVIDAGVASDAAGTRLFAFGRGFQVQIRRWANGALERNAYLEATHAAAHPDGRRAVFATPDAVVVWDVDRGKALFECFAPEGGTPVALALLEDPSLAAAAYQTGEVRVWDVDASVLVAERRATRGESPIRALAALPAGGGGGFLAVEEDGGLTAWKITSGAAAAGAATWPYESLSLLAGGDEVVARALSGAAPVWDLATGASRGPLVPSELAPRGALLYADARVALWSDASSVALVGRADGARLGGEHDHGLDGVEVRFAVARGGALLAASAREPDSVDLIALDSGVGAARATRVALGPHPGWVTAIAFADPGGAPVLLVGTRAGTVHAWRAGDGTRLFDAVASEAAVVAVRATGGGRAVVWDAAGAARDWDVNAGALGPAVVHGGGVVDVAGDGHAGWFATLGEDGRARAWDAASGRPLGSFGGPEDPLVAIAAGLEGREIVAASRAGEVSAWDARSGAPVARCAAGGEVRALVATRRGHVAWLSACDGLAIVAREDAPQGPGDASAAARDAG